MTKQEKIEELFWFIQDWVGLGFRAITLQFDEGVSVGYDATVTHTDYPHMIAEVSISTESWEETKEGVDKYAKLLLHELCHIFTGAGGDVYEKEKIIYQAAGEVLMAAVGNRATGMEEIYACFLDRVMRKYLLEDKGYKDLKKTLLK